MSTLKCEIVVYPTHDASKIWAKWVKGIDRSAQGGYRFVGDFLRLGSTHIVSVGAIILVVYTDRILVDEKEIKTSSCEIYKVIADASLVKKAQYKGKDWSHKASKHIERLASLGDPDLEKLSYSINTIAKLVDENLGYAMLVEEGFDQLGFEFRRRGLDNEG